MQYHTHTKIRHNPFTHCDLMKKRVLGATVLYPWWSWMASWSTAIRTPAPRARNVANGRSGGLGSVWLPTAFDRWFLILMTNRWAWALINESNMVIISPRDARQRPLTTSPSCQLSAVSLHCSALPATLCFPCLYSISYSLSFQSYSEVIPLLTWDSFLDLSHLLISHRFTLDPPYVLFAILSLNLSLSLYGYPLRLFSLGSLAKKEDQYSPRERHHADISNLNAAHKDLGLRDAHQDVLE